jgi:hypothetical protein
MKIIIFILIAVIAVPFGLCAFSQIIYPLFYAWPRARQLEREGKLKKSIPIASFLLSPFIWSILFLASIWIVNNYFSNYVTLYYVELGFILFAVIVQISKKNPDIEADFKDSWKQYLKDE